MNKAKGLGAVISLLLLANLSLMAWNLHQNFQLRTTFKQYGFQVLRTNDMTGIGWFEVKTGQPIWTRFSEGGQPIVESHYFQGKVVFDITSSSNLPPKYSVFFRNPDKSVTWWLDRRGAGSFTERIYYDTNSSYSKHEIWYEQGWQTVERRHETNGIVRNGQWSPVKFDTNGAWTIDSRNNQPSR